MIDHLFCIGNVVILVAQRGIGSDCLLRLQVQGSASLGLPCLARQQRSFEQLL
jgi:hypothetical protein